MKRKLTLLSLLFVPFISTAQCIEEAEPNVLLVGDSWAFFMDADATFNNVLSKFGHTNKTYFTNPTLAVNGARTNDFLEAGRLGEIENQLLTKPTIKVVHLSITGNDFLGDWNVGFTPEETEALSDDVYDRLTVIVNYIKAVRSDISIVFSGYMYANFEEVINDAAPFETSHPFYDRWETMGFPNFEQLNTLLNDFSLRVQDLADADPRIQFMNVPALMQYAFGQDIPLGVPPGGSYPPFAQPLPFGDITYPSPKETMRDYGIVRDCFHLSEAGFFEMISYQTQRYYQKALMDDFYVVADAALNNGTVSLTGAVSNDLWLGRDGADDYTTILDFNTTGMVDTTIESASIFLRRESVEIDSPLDLVIDLRIVNGYFGSDETVGPEDFIDEGAVHEYACVYGSLTEDGDWVRIDLPESFLTHVKNDDHTQFMLSTPDSEMGQIVHFSGTDDPQFAPVLNCKFKSSFANMEQIGVTQEIQIFPNPTANYLTVKTDDLNVRNIEVRNMQGQLVLSPTQNTFNVSELAVGSYIISLRTDTGVYTAKFQKK